MKRMVSILSILIMVTLSMTAMPSFAQELPASYRLGGTGDDTATAMIPLEDGNLLVAASGQGGRDGAAEHPRHARWMWLFCLSPDGNILWETEYGEEKGYCALYDLRVKDGTVTGTLKHSVDDRWQYEQQRTYSLSDGALLYEGEKTDLTARDRNIGLYSYPVGDMTLEESIYDALATCEPRIYRLLDADGNELWSVDAKEIGMDHQEGRIRYENSTLLAGRLWMDEAVSDQPVVLRIDDSGKVLWRTALSDVTDGVLHEVIIDSQGRAVLAGFVRGAKNLDAQGYITSYEPSSQLLLCVDPAMGAPLWRHENLMQPDEVLPIGNLTEVDEGYLLAASNLGYTGNALELLDFDGNARARWTTSSLPEATIIGQRVFRWQEGLWMESMLELDGVMDIYIERVELPPVSEAIDASIQGSDDTSQALHQTARQMTVEWEAELGPHPFWPLEKKVEFYQRFGTQPTYSTAITSPIALPEESDLPQEAAIADARLYVLDAFQLTEAELDACKISVDFYPDGGVSGVSGSERTWVIGFCQSEPNNDGEYWSDFVAYVPSPRGEPTVLRNLTVPLLMSWGLSEQAAIDLTERPTVYYNPQGGKYFHRDLDCSGIPEKYQSVVESFDLWLLPTEAYSELTPCPICLP